MKRRELFGRVLASICLAGSLTCSAWIFKENSDSITRWNLRSKAILSPEKLAYMSSGSLNGIIKDFDEYIATRDDSFEIRSDLARLKTWQYQLSVLEAFKVARPDLKEVDLWQSTSPNFLLDTIVKYQAIGFVVPVEVIRERQDVVKYLSSATKDLYAARRICPFYSKVNERLLSLLPLTTNLSWRDERLLAELYARRAASLVPHSCAELLKNGYYLSFYKLYELQKLFLNRSLEHNLETSGVILNTLSLSTPSSQLTETLDEVIPNDLQTILEVYQKASKWGKTSPVYNAVKAKFDKTLAETPDDCRDASFYYYSAIFNESLEEYERADEDYCRALELEPYNPQYCLDRIRFLIKHRKILNKDVECVQFINKVLPKLRGSWRRSCEDYLEIAKKNALDADSRKRARERVKNEREMDERIRQIKKSDVGDDTDSLSEIPSVADEDKGFERSFDEELRSFDIDDALPTEER